MNDFISAYMFFLLVNIFVLYCRKFGGKTPLDLATNKPEVLSLVKRFTSFSPPVNGHQNEVPHQLQHSISVASGGSGRVRSISVSLVIHITELKTS